MRNNLATTVASLCAAAVFAATFANPAAAYHEKRERYYKQRQAEKRLYVRPREDKNWFTCRYNCGDPLRPEGMDWWQSRALDRGGGNGIRR